MGKTQIKSANMRINNINSVSFKAQEKKHNKYINSKVTGYLTLGALSLSLSRGFIKNKAFKKNHKTISIITGLLAAFHLFGIKFNELTYKKSIQNNQN